MASGGGGSGGKDIAEMPGRLARAIAALDIVNADDPNRVDFGGEQRPKELAHAELATRWVRRLRRDPSEELQLAARGHHLRRWAVPRSSYPSGRDGYLRWRADLRGRHAEEVGATLRAAGYGEDAIARVRAIVRRERLTRDPDVQALEDALCLIFFETQYEEMRSRLDAGQMERVVRRTWRKMSPAAREFAAALPLSAEGRALVGRAVTGAVREPPSSAAGGQSGYER